jgi:predicted Zn-dependent protease
MKLTIVPFESLPPGPLPREVARRLRGILPWRFVVAAPQSDLSAVGGAGALDAELLLSLLPRSRRHDELMVALTGCDLTARELGPVFGYAAPHLYAACVSLHRLTDGTQGRRGGRRLLVERAAKEILHEVGHLMGLPHCERAGCVMQYSQTLHDTDIKGCRFCAECLREMSRLPEPAAEAGGGDDGL